MRETMGLTRRIPTRRFKVRTVLADAMKLGTLAIVLVFLACGPENKAHEPTDDLNRIESQENALST